MGLLISIRDLYVSFSRLRIHGAGPPVHRSSNQPCKLITIKNPPLQSATIMQEFCLIFGILFLSTIINQVKQPWR